MMIAAATLAFSCKKPEPQPEPEPEPIDNPDPKPEEPKSPWEKEGEVSINVGAEMIAGQFAMPVQDGDILKVFDEEAAGVDFSFVSATADKAIFKATGWTAKKPAFAAYSPASRPFCNVEQGTVTVSLPAEQVLEGENVFVRTALPLAGKVVADATEEYKIEEMKVVPAFLEFVFIDGTVVNSVTVEGLNGEQVAGGVNVAVEDMSWTLGPNPATSVVLTAAGNAFQSGVKYYAAILPGNYPMGIKVTMRGEGDFKMVKTFGEEGGFALNRNAIKAFGEAIDTVPPPELEEEFVVAVDFTKAWPFKEAAGASSFTYDHKGLIDLTFALSGTYSYADGAASFSEAGGKIYLPVVEDHYLNSVVIVHKPGAKKRVEIYKASDDTQIGVRYVTHNWKKPVPVAKFSPHSAEQCYISMLDAMDVTNIYLLYNSTETGADAVKLGFESQYRNFNNNNGNTGGEGDGSQYLYQGADGTPTSTQDGTALSPFVGIVARATPGATWTDETVPNPYTFTQTCNGVEYVFESVRPDDPEQYKLQRMWNWQNGLWSMDWGTPNLLKVPRTGKLVWVGVACGNGYSATKDRRFGVLAKDVEDDDFSEVGDYTFLASAKQGTGDGLTVENSADYKAWCLDDDYSPTKDYYMSVISGSTCYSFMVLVYL